MTVVDNDPTAGFTRIIGLLDENGEVYCGCKDPDLAAVSHNAVYEAAVSLDDPTFDDVTRERAEDLRDIAQVLGDHNKRRQVGEASPFRLHPSDIDAIISALAIHRNSVKAMLSGEGDTAVVQAIKAWGAVRRAVHLRKDSGVPMDPKDAYSAVEEWLEEGDD